MNSLPNFKYAKSWRACVIQSTLVLLCASMLSCFGEHDYAGPLVVTDAENNDRISADTHKPDSNTSSNPTNSQNDVSPDNSRNASENAPAYQLRGSMSLSTAHQRGGPYSLSGAVNAVTTKMRHDALTFSPQSTISSTQ